MKKIKLFFALFAMLALGVGNAWGATYSLTPDKNGTGLSNTAYITSLTEFTNNGISWKMNQWNPSTLQIKTNQSTAANEWRFYNTSAIPGKITKVVIKFSALTLKNTSATGFKFVGGSSAVTETTGGTDGVWDTSAKTLTWTPSASDNFTYFALYQNGKVASGTNKLATSDAIVVTYEASGSTETVVSSIQISGDLTNKTYEEGDELDFTGLTVTAKYDDNSEEDVTNDVEWSYTPNPLAKGTTSVNITAKYEDKTATTPINGLTVNEHIITPGEHCTGTLGYEFWGLTAEKTTATANEIDYTKKFNDITINIKNGEKANAYFKADHTRVYSGGYTMTFSVPTGYLITDIAFTPDEGDNWVGEHTADVGEMTDNKNWSGLSQSVTISFKGTCRITNICVTYIEDVKSTLTINTPQNGTISVKNGTTEIATGTQVSAGTLLVVTPTPVSGYLFESLIVDGTQVELTVDGTYTFIMPKTDVTISATFKVNEAPDAVLQLMANGEEVANDTHKVGYVATLPTTIENDCAKTFVGWSENENCTTEPEYAPGAEFTLTETEHLLYAVYADESLSGNKVEEYSFSYFDQADEIILDSPEAFDITLLKGSASTAPQWNSSKSEARIYAKGSMVITATLPIYKVVYTYNVNANSKGVTPTIDGVTGKVNNGSWDAETKTWTGNDTEVTFSTSGTAGNVGFSKVEVTVGAIVYSNYSTTCVAALDEPVFSVEGGENEAKTITLTATEGTIYYTLDGTTPTASSEKYTTPIVLDECGEHTIKAIAISSDSESPVASATYTIQLPIEKGTEESPLSVADVLAIYNGGCYNGTDEVYVTGTVSSASYNTTYSNYTVTLTDNSFQFYRLVDESNLVTNNQMQNGDVVIAKGKLGEYQGKCQLIECVLIDYKAYEGVKTDISNNVDDPYTVEEAYALIDDVSSDLDNSEVYVKGIISKVDSYNTTYKSITYWISDDGTTTKQLQVYSGKGLNNTDFVSKNDLQVGDKVIVFGKLKKHETTYEFDYNNYIVSLERPEQEETVAALPFTFTGSLSDIENTDGMKQIGLGSYNTSLKLKFDDTGDYLTIHFDGEPGRLRYGIKGNPSNNVMSCTYKVQTSVDGTTYTDLETYTTLANTEKTMSHALNSDVRYVKFIFAEKKSGNVALGNITISQPAIVIGDDDNSSVIATAVAAGNPVDVIVNRSFTANAGYYTLCVPFNMPASTIGTAYKLGAITKHVSGEEGGININLTKVDNIEAGVPYLIEPNITVDELLVENVTIVNTTGSDYTIVGDGVKIKFTGIINGVGETTNNSTEYYVGNGGYLYNGTVEKLGLRAFFTITDEAGNPTKVRARVVAGENVETGVEDIITTDAPVKVIVNGQLIIIRDGVKYNVQGQKL